ncbi:DUF7344 domain-containing protein [Salinarchaeum laminariae]|uniref:DUF7344 domain-containing protein n=1 Tax=Salinarchaeum laminariae TaxID=869888 RepID=UPI0020BF11E2|nr:hypothetical protein [Salinarchaeum laminariae]
MDADVPTDELLQALANPHRRLVLRELVESPCEVIPVSELEAAVFREIDRSTSQIRTQSETAILLRHVHLPALADAGLCEYDSDRERVVYDPDEFAESLLAFIEERRRADQIH